MEDCSCKPGERDQYGYLIEENSLGRFEVMNKEDKWIGTFPSYSCAELYTYYRGKEMNGK